MHSSTNNYGTSSNSSVLYIRPGYGPQVIGYPTVFLAGVNIYIDWSITFTSDYIIDNFEVLFLSSSNNWYELPIYCGPGISSYLYYQ
jgi:hypothetical protein